MVIAGMSTGDIAALKSAFLNPSQHAEVTTSPATSTPSATLDSLSAVLHEASLTQCVHVSSAHVWAIVGWPRRGARSTTRARVCRYEGALRELGCAEAQDLSFLEDDDCAELGIAPEQLAMLRVRLACA